MKKIINKDFEYENKWFRISSKGKVVIYRLSNNKLKIRIPNSGYRDAIIRCSMIEISGSKYIKILNDTLFDHSINTLEDICVHIIKQGVVDGMAFDTNKTWTEKAPGIEIIDGIKIYAPRIERVDRRKYNYVTARIRRTDVNVDRAKSSNISVDARKRINGNKIQIDIISPWRQKDRNKNIELYLRGHHIPIARLNMSGNYAYIDDKLYAVIESIDDNIQDILGDTFGLLIQSALGSLNNQHMFLPVDGFIYHFRNQSYKRGIHSWKLKTERQLRIQKSVDGYEYSHWRLRFRKMDDKNYSQVYMDKYILKIDNYA